MDESDMEIGETTPTKHSMFFVPETPSPVFSRIAHKKDLITSPSKRKYWFEDVQGKVVAEVNKNGQLKTAEYDNKKIAFDRLKKIRQKKKSNSSLYNHTDESSSGARPKYIWPSDSDSDSSSDTNTGQTLSALLNRDKKIKQSSPVNQPNRSMFDPMTSAVSTPPDSPSTNLPLRKRIRLLGTFGLNTQPDKESTASNPCSSSFHSNKHHTSKSKQRKLTDNLKLSLTDFVSARDFFNSKKHSKPETSTSLGSASYNDCRLKTHQDSDKRDTKHNRRKAKKDNEAKSVDRLKSLKRGSNIEAVDMELTPPFRVGNVQSDFSASESLSALPANSFYKKSPVKKRAHSDPKSRESASTSSSETERQPRKPSKSRSKRPSTTSGAQEIIDVESDEDAVVVVNQLESDETMAKRLQEEMDHEFALAVASSHTPSHSEAGVGTHNRVARGRPPLSQGFGMSMFHEFGSDEDGNIPNFPFMVTESWGQSPLALLTSHVALLGSSASWTSPMNTRRSGGRGSRGRRGRRNAVFEMNSPGVDGEDYEALLDLAESIGDVKPKGLTKTEINRLPVNKFVPSSSDNSQNKECLVCMCEFEKDEKVRILTCFHDFHAKCIDKWLKGNGTCPICREEVRFS